MIAECLTVPFMRNMGVKCIPIVFLLIFAGFEHAYTKPVYSIKTIPNPRTENGGYVSNPDSILSQAAVSSINAQISLIEKATTAEIAVVVVTSIGNADPNVFATELFNLWGIGKKGKDNGVLVFVSVDQHKWKIETGYGVEGTLPDIICGRIAREILVPEFKKGNYGEGIFYAIQRIGALISKDTSQNAVDKRVVDKKSGSDDWVLWLVLFLYFSGTVLGGYFLFRSFRKTIRNAESPQDAYNKLDGYARPSMITSVVAALLVPGAIVMVWLVFARRRLRYAPRVSLKNGKPMHLLTEKEEDKFLSKGQILEEHLKSKNYDVWTTDDEDDVMVLGYNKEATHFTKCPSCQFITYQLHDVKIMKEATRSRTGQKKCTYHCDNCNHEETVLKTIPRITSSSGSSSRSSSGSSGSSGSFGGGSSGGGGAGGDW